MDYEKARKKIDDYFNNISPEEFIKVCENHGMEFVSIDEAERHNISSVDNSDKKLAIEFGIYLTGHDKETVEQMFADWIKYK